jgi:hypothetical protein
MGIEDNDRRAPGATRIPFEALVEVGGALGPSFEAQAIDVSEDGMHLRTAYLPEIGQPLTCRFDTGRADGVLASGEVVWKQEAGRGGEFGIRFTDLDPESARALSIITGTGPEAPKPRGAKVRLHIDGLDSPMRARVKGSGRTELTVGSELGFLQVGKQLELEDAETGKKRPARIDRVEVQIDPNSHIPQLVVALRYDDEEAAMMDAEGATREATPEPTVMDEEMDEDAVEEEFFSDAARVHGAQGADAPAEMTSKDDDAEMESIRSTGDKVKIAMGRGMAKVGPAFASFSKRAKTTIALLVAKREQMKLMKEEGAPRRMTAPPPGGGLHAEGRKVVRGDSMHDAKKESDSAAKIGRFQVSKKKMALGGAVGMALLLCAVAMRKPSTPAPTAGSAGDPAAIAAPVAPAIDPLAPVATAQMPAPLAGATPLAVPPAMVSDAMPTVSEPDPSDDRPAHRKPIHVIPFGNGAVSHGNVLRLKMDGAIEKIQGATQPTGFTVAVPDRRSLEAAGPLAARDSRIASIKVTNDGAGAELAVAFKDGVPNYQVRAKGDMLEIVLAPIGGVATLSSPKNSGSANVGITSSHEGGITAKRGHGHTKR